MYGSARSTNNAGAIVASEEPWAGIPEVVAHLHVSTDTAYRRVDTQGLTAHRVDRLFRFRLPQTDVWVQSRGGGIAISFVAEQSSIYDAWNAMANLADVAGTISIHATATAPEGHDKAKLENGVFEPLRELGLIDDD